MRTDLFRTFIGVLPMAAAALWLAGNPSQAQPTISTNFALPSGVADTSKPGFLWNFHQIRIWQPSTQQVVPNTLQRVEDQLSGLLGNNVGNPDTVGVAAGPAATPNPLTAPMTFTIPTVINLDRAAGSSGNFKPDDQMPGCPGLTSSTDLMGAEVLTWLNLPAGLITMGVNSDDGFRVQIGGATPGDRSAVVVGEYDASRGAANSFFQFRIAKAGLYAARLVYEQGYSNARVEWFTVVDTGGGTTNLVLINDTSNGGIAAYRGVTGAQWASVRKALPAQMTTMAAPNTPVTVELLDGSTAINPATVQLSLDGVTVGTAQKTGSVTTVGYTPTTPLASFSKHTVTLAYTEGSAARSLSWSFTVASYPTLKPASKVTADTSKPGFIWNVFANSSDIATTMAKATSALAGTLADAAGNLLPNLADPSVQGAAIAAGTAPSVANGTVRFEIAGTINLSIAGGDSNGNFPSDEQMPGLPATDYSTDGVAAEALTFVELPAGVTTMGVNSDDGFRTTTGALKDLFGAVYAGGFDGARQATDADIILYVVAQEAGVYAFRTVWVQGTGFGNLEWFTVKADGTKVLLNDRANGGLKAYRAIVEPLPPYVKSVSPDPVPRQLNLTSSALVVAIGDGTHPVNDASVVLKVDGKTVVTTTNRQGDTFTVTYTPTTVQTPSEGHTAEVTFQDSTGTYSGRQTWRFYNLKNIVLPTTPALIEDFDSYAEGTVPTGWVEKNFTATVNAGEDLGSLKSDSYKGWLVVTRDRIVGLKGSIANCAAGQTVNGLPITFDDLCQGSLIYAESDVRGGSQVQFLTSKPFNLSHVTNVLVSFSSLYTQNQDNVNAMEYSVDGGVNWLPVVYYLDTKDSSGPDIWLNDDGSVDAVKTFTAPNYDAAVWVDNGVQKGLKYGDGLLAPITQALAPFVAARWNDNQVIDKRWEIYRLPMASRQSDVRLRFVQLGTGSWYWGIDKLAFYDVPAPAAPVLTIAGTGNDAALSWTGSGTLQEATSITGPWSVSAKQSNPQAISLTTGTKFYRIGQP